MARRDEDDDAGQPWHNRTSTVVGASILALLVIGVLIAAATTVARQFGETEQAPLDFVAPTYSATGSGSAGASTTTRTITSTSPPQTTDIDGPSTSPSSSTSSTTSTTTSSPTSTEPTTARTEEDEPTTTRTTRRTPRTNVTRTFNPYP